MFKVMDKNSTISPSNIGTKAYNLYFLYKNGVNIPDTYCLPNKYCADFIISNGLYDEIKKMVYLDNYDALKYKYLNIIKHKNRFKIPYSLVDVLKQLLKKNTLWAIRSSSAYEDTLSASFAGIYKSIIGIPSDLVILGKALRKVWLSSFSHDLITYMKNIIKLNPKEILEIILHGMPVIIQELINSEKSGLVFSEHPVNPKHSEFFFECIRGLLEPLTSGMIWNESFIFDGNKVFSHFFEEQRLGFFAIKNINKNLLPGDKVQLFQENKPRIFSYFKKRSKYIHILRLPFELWNTPVLSDPEILKIYNTLSHVSNKFPKAEAEWTIKNGKIYFLQIRPITTQSNFPNYRFYLDHKGEFQGLGVSSGYAEGTLFFWKNKIDENLENKILVVHEMTPDLLPYYSKIKGIISETGSVLCHGAILSREFEIPCVILPKAAQLLRFFKKVAIDGYEGKVIKLE
ncbi:phosphoenolpyruvate synthase [Thermosipho africanus Ob7]|jgi:pyruvate,water dikinase|uniref:PEP/pyruvate-binding domain-containing protein n=1 Tax=Thermosipho africanus TaxID=2421 RepID=UPI000E0ACF6F|nr:PEP/pyruvate-binding domain-containing protein [Thermosipho africanus]MDK2838695.1 pyruvate, water dikinase [Thermosipho sp. (in: thermotogales)]RDI90933.1 phosphoenolpyruvate synthase [Thermosipho africanus Ob7]